MSGYVPIWHRIPPGLVEDTRVVIGCVFVNNSIDILVVKSPAVPLKTILLVEDADGKRLTRKWFLGSLGYAVDAVRSAEEALGLFKAETHDVVVATTALSGMTGPELAHVIKMRSP